MTDKAVACGKLKWQVSLPHACLMENSASCPKIFIQICDSAEILWNATPK